MKRFNNRVVKNALLTFTTLILVFMMACNSTDTQSTVSNANGQETNTEKIYNLKMNISQPPSQPGWEWEPKNIVTEVFAELVKERTNGRVTIDLFYSNQLAGPGESLDALARGTIDLQNGSFTEWADKVPEGNIASLPFLKMGEDHAQYLMRETEVGTLFEQALEEYGVKPLIYWPVSISGYMSTSPIASPDNFKGLIFNNHSNLTNDFYKTMGAGTASVPYAELYEAFLRGTIDVTQFSLYTLETYKLHEVVDAITVPTTLDPGLALVSIGKPSWDKLPADLQKILLDVALEIEYQSIEASKQMTERTLDFAEKNNVEIVRLTEESYNQFVELSKEKVWAKFGDFNDRTKKMIEVVNVSTQKWLEQNPDAKQNVEKYLAK